MTTADRIVVCYLIINTLCRLTDTKDRFVDLNPLTGSGSYDNRTRFALDAFVKTVVDVMSESSSNPISLPE